MTDPDEDFEAAMNAWGEVPDLPALCDLENPEPCESCQ